MLAADIVNEALAIMARNLPILGQKINEAYSGVYAMFPKWKYHPEKAPVVIANTEEEKCLGPGWTDVPCGNYSTQGNTDPAAARKRFLVTLGAFQASGAFQALGAFQANNPPQPQPPAPAPLLHFEEAQPAPMLFLNFISDAQR